MKPRGPIHRVALHLAGPDPRIALRETPPDEALFARLDRMGPWTYEYLAAIGERTRGPQPPTSPSPSGASGWTSSATCGG